MKMQESSSSALHGIVIGIAAIALLYALTTGRMNRRRIRPTIARCARYTLTAAASMAGLSYQDMESAND